MTIAEIKARLASVDDRQADMLLELIERDGRAGLRSLASLWRRKKERLARENTRLRELTRYERMLGAQGFGFVAGVDEAGRGALAGPLVAAAVILPINSRLHGLRDSKRLTPDQRDKLFEPIKETARAWHIVEVDAGLIDANGIQWANLHALEQAVRGLVPRADYVLSDAFALPSLKAPHLAITGGDNLSLTIAAASVLAKVARDRIMVEQHRLYPRYGFDRHKGYGTDDHCGALEEHGPSPIHRLCFEPVAKARQLNF
ncbi:MAG: ribonuclease HII [Actinobacteria bacterium]|nr:ribonuclease HII [Actinomycetota bacterium]